MNRFQIMVKCDLPGHLETVEVPQVEGRGWPRHGGGTVQYNTVQYTTVKYSTVQYSTVQHSALQYSTVQTWTRRGWRGARARQCPSTPAWCRGWTVCCPGSSSRPQNRHVSCVWRGSERRIFPIISGIYNNNTTSFSKIMKVYSVKAKH